MVSIDHQYEPIWIMLQRLFPLIEDNENVNKIFTATSYHVVKVISLK